MDDFGSFLGYGVVVLSMALLIYAVVVYEWAPRRRAAIRDQVMPVPAPSPPALEPSFSPDPAHNDIRSHSCANCGRQFLEMSYGPVWMQVAGSAQRVWYCSTACADAMPFLPDPNAQAWAQSMRAQLERDVPGRSPSVYTEAIRLRRRAEERRRRDAEMTRLQNQVLGHVRVDGRRIGRNERIRPAHFTGQEPEDL